MKILSFLFILFILLIGTTSFAAEVVIITNQGNPVSTITVQDAKQIYLGKKSTWSNGNGVKAFTQKNAQITEMFSKKFVKKSSQQFNLYWRKAIFTGKGTPPVEVINSEEMKKMVASETGSIGYILDTEVDSSVKQLKVQ